jgi:cation diffusion facilitator CzcD-associated flavoprotein CzcO
VSNHRALRFAVIGAGMAGILATIRLRELAYDDVTVFEKGDRVGGTWRENTYPGLACDVPSQLYSYSFAPNPEWTHPYSPGSQIQAYFERVADDHGVTDRTRFSDEVVRCEWVDDRWHLETASGHRDTFDVVIATTGVLHHPRYPEIRGLDSFAGACFHSARWDHSVELDGARVGVIGTGSTGVQIITALRDRVDELVVFQRTAQWVLPMPNDPFGPEQLERHQDLDFLRATHDKLSELFGKFSNAVIDATSPESEMIASACLDNLERNVIDPELREMLRPTYRAACKRLIASPDFYEAMQAPATRLVTADIASVEARGVRTADGLLHELDVLVLATGFHADWFVRPMTVVGRDGITIDQFWTPRPLAYLSIGVPGFPNFFMINGPNGPVGNFSLIEVAEHQFDYISQLVERLAIGASSIEPDLEFTRTFEEERVAASRNSVWVTGCRSWYLDDRGVPATWPWPFDRFQTEMAIPNWSAYRVE